MKISNHDVNSETHSLKKRSYIKQIDGQQIYWGKEYFVSPSTFRIRTSLVLWSSKKSAWQLFRCVCLSACSYILIFLDDYRYESFDVLKQVGIISRLVKKGTVGAYYYKNDIER